MGPLKSALIAGLAGALCALAVLILVLARVSPIVVVLLLVPVSVGLLVALWVWREGTWRHLMQRRAALMLQSAGALLISRSMSGIGFGVLRAVGSFTASETGDSLGVAFEYALGSRGGIAWDFLSAVLGLAFIMASVWVVRSSMPTSTSSGPEPLSFLLFDPPPLTQSQLNRARTYKTYDSDLPPRTDYWVGREDEIRLARELKRGVLTVTGIGGQGKSYLAAKVLEAWRAEHPSAFWDWRDCREQGDRFETQLMSVIERLTAGDIIRQALAGADPDGLARLLFRITRGSVGVIILDNVDHYTNAEEGAFIRGVDALVREAFRSKTELLIVLTCRPRISYPDIAFREIPLRGLSLEETTELFAVKRADLRRFPDPAAAIRQIHSHTRGIHSGSTY